MEPVGTIIKLARESRKLTISQVAEATRISYRHLQSIEDGRYRDLPGGMYNRAFVRAYAEHLGLDSHAILERYAAEAPQAEKPKPKAAMVQPSPPSHGHPVAAWSVMLLISVTGIFFSRHWIAEVFSPYFSRSPAVTPRVAAPESRPPAGQPPAPAPSIPVQTAAAPDAPAANEQQPVAVGPVAADTAAQRPTTAEPAAQQPAAAEPATQQLPAAAPPATQATTGKLQIRLQATENCWTSVTSDSTRVLNAELKPGDEHSFGAQHQFTIVLGNAGGVSLSINGKPAKPLGKSGQVIKAIITEQNLTEYLPTSNP